MALPVYFAQIFKFVCDLAEKEIQDSSNINGLKNYYVLTLLMAGLVDDLQDSLNQMLRAAKLPVSIIIIKLSLENQENDQKKFIKGGLEAFK